MSAVIPSIVLKDVSKHFGKLAAIGSVSAKIMPGEITGLVGPDGAGKTTLIRMMAGLMQPNGGEITVLEKQPAEINADFADQIGYMPQRFGLYEDLSVMENLRLYADLRFLKTNDQQEIFAKLLEFTRLSPFIKRLAGRLSGGMKQKLGLACALMASPKVLLLDEPGVGVDPVSRRDLWRMVTTLTGEGVAVVWATAYLDEAEQCDSVLLLHEGELKFSGKPSLLTQKIERRSFALSGFEDNRRKALKTLLDLPAVCDGVIQGESIRLVLHEHASINDIQMVTTRGHISIEAVQPRFEDAFVDLLGGGPGGTSKLAEKTQVVDLAIDEIVKCRHLTKKFGAFTATDDVSFTVRRGEIFGLLGPNGAGKSTTFNMLCGLLKPTSGEAFVAGLNLREANSEAKRQLGYMAQKFSLYGLLSVKQNLEFSAGVYGLEGIEKRERIEEMVDIFHLQNYLNNSPDELSLGFKQRLALACSLMHRPPVLFLDEPTSGVDPITRREFWMHINGLVDKGVSVLVTTHFMDEAEYCDRVALLYQAKLIALDTPDALKAASIAHAGEKPTMEEAFIRLIERVDEQGKRP